MPQDGAAMRNAIGLGAATKTFFAIVFATMVVVAFGCKNRNWNPLGSTNGNGGSGPANISGTYSTNIASCVSGIVPGAVVTKLTCTISYSYTDSSNPSLPIQYYTGTLYEIQSNGTLCSSETLLVTYDGSYILNFLPSGVGCFSFTNLSTLSVSSTSFSGTFSDACPSNISYPVWTFVKQ